MSNEIKQQLSKCCYLNWLAQQQLDLDELLQVLNNYPADIDYHQLITNKMINHFENYRAARALLAKHDATTYLVPPWGTTFENSFLWIGGCRPSIMIRLVYALCGAQLNAHLEEFLDGVRHGTIGEISSSQLKSIDDLHGKTIKEEDKLGSCLATLQEGIGDDPMVLLANRFWKPGEWRHSKAVEQALDGHALDVYKVMVEADKLRMDTLKGIIDILTPLQATELLVASKNLHLCLHEWSKKRDIQSGSTRLPDPDYPSSSNDLPPCDQPPSHCP